MPSLHLQEPGRYFYAHIQGRPTRTRRPVLFNNVAPPIFPNFLLLPYSGEEVVSIFSLSYLAIFSCRSSLSLYHYAGVFPSGGEILLTFEFQFTFCLSFEALPDVNRQNWLCYFLHATNTSDESTHSMMLDYSMFLHISLPTRLLLSFWRKGPFSVHFLFSSIR